MPTTFQKAERRVKTSDGWSNPISYATSSESVEMTNGTDLQTKMNAVDQTISSHTSNTSNPHNVTKSQVGLGNVDNTSDANKPISTATQTALDGKLSASLKGANSGLAELDANGKVPSSQLPSYVDDVLEYSSKSSFPTTGETGKIYVDTSTNLTYRWSGTAYVEISPSLALGETSSTAYRGDRGKTAYDHSQSTHARTDATKTEASSTNGNIKINGTETTVYTHPGSGTNPHGTTKTDVGLGNVGNFKAVSTVASQGLTTTEQSNARANIGAGTSNLTIGTTSTTALAGDTKYAGASTAGGAATSAEKLTNTSKIGDTNKPVYFTANGVPTAISYTIGKSVPSDALFTDTTYSLVGANGTTGLIKNGSTVTSSSGYTACPIISGIPYYKDTNTTTGTRNNITSRLSNLSQAVAEQNLGKYGYKIGDYFVGASGYNYILADYNTFKGTSTPYCLTTNHIGIVVDTKATSKWHTEDAANVGYNGSTLHTYLKGTVLDNIKTDFIGLFGGSTGLEHLLPHSKLLTTALANWGWQANQYISALSEVQTIGSVVWGANGYQTGEASKKLELFDKYKWTELFESRYPWLRDLYTSSYACYLNGDGYAAISGVALSLHVVGLINFY